MSLASPLVIPCSSAFFTQGLLWYLPSGSENSYIFVSTLFFSMKKARKLTYLKFWTYNYEYRDFENLIMNVFSGLFVPKRYSRKRRLFLQAASKKESDLQLVWAPRFKLHGKGSVFHYHLRWDCWPEKSPGFFFLFFSI